VCSMGNAKSSASGKTIQGNGACPSSSEYEVTPMANIYDSEHDDKATEPDSRPLVMQITPEGVTFHDANGVRKILVCRATN